MRLNSNSAGGNLLAGADKESLEAVVNFAVGTGKALAGIEAVVSRAAYIAKRSGRGEVSRADIRDAIKIVIPNDGALQEALSPLTTPTKHQATAGLQPRDGNTAAASNKKPVHNRFTELDSAKTHKCTAGPSTPLLVGKK